MTYSRQRLEYTLKVIRQAKADDKKRLLSAYQVDRSLRNKYEFRNQLHINPSTPRVSRWLDEGSDTEDDNYYPSGKKQKKRRVLEKPIRQKRKALDRDDTENRKRRIKLRSSSLDELSRKFAFITLKVASDKGKDLLKRLADEHGTGLDASRLPTSLCNADLDTWSWEKELRKWTDRTYEDAFNAEIDGIDNTDGRALRNRKVPEIAMPTKKLKSEGQDMANAYPHEVEDSKTQHDGDGSMSTHFTGGLPSPALTPPERPRSSIRASSIVTISSESSSTAPIAETIQTRWAHPIDFQLTAQQGAASCHFCNDCLFGVHGLIPRTVQVVNTGTNNKKFMECGGTTPSGTNGPTKMCVKCALARIYISNCHVHDLRALDGLDPTSPGLDKDKMPIYVAQIVNRKGIENNETVHPVCSICPGPALYQCSTKQTFKRTGGVYRPGEECWGCGLLVCRQCQRIISAHYGVLKEYVITKWNRSLRADWSFLFKGSLLHEAYGLI